MLKIVCDARGRIRLCGCERLQGSLKTSPNGSEKGSRYSSGGMLGDKVVAVRKKASVITVRVMKTKGCGRFGFVPVIKVIGGNLSKLFPISDDVTFRVDEFVELPISAALVEEFACFTKMSSM